MRGYSLRRCAFSDYCGSPCGQKRPRSGDAISRCNISIQSNLKGQMKRETGYGCYADWQTAVWEVWHLWLRRNMRYGCRRKIKPNWSD